MRSNFEGLQPLAIYELGTIFDAVAADKQQALKAVKNHPSAAPMYYNHSAEAADRILSVLDDWRQAGATHIIAKAPFSDGYGNLGSPSHSIAAQMRKGHVQPLTNPELPDV